MEEHIHRSFSEAVRVSVVIPSSDGRRGGNVPLLLADLEAQTVREMEVLVVVGVSPHGRAINQGVARVSGEYLVILDDDTRLLQQDAIEKMLQVLDSDRAIGMVGASIVQPSGGSLLQRLAARELPRLSMDVVQTVTDSDMPCHGCCAFRREVFDEVGREREEILRGLDPDLRQRLRQRGYRVVLAPGVKAVHPVPGTLRSISRMFFRNGLGSAYIQCHAPHIVYETDERMVWNGDPLRKPFLYRLARFPLRSLGYLCRGRVLRLFGDTLYAAGYLYGLLRNRPRRRLRIDEPARPS